MYKLLFHCFVSRWEDEEELDGVKEIDVEQEKEKELQGFAPMNDQEKKEELGTGVYFPNK